MCCQLINLTNSPIDWISTVKDIALVILSGTAVVFGYIQHRRSIRAEWVKVLRIEIAKLISTSIRIGVSEVDFRKETSESVSLINLYLNENNAIQETLLKQVDELVKLWLAQRQGQRQDEKIIDLGDKVIRTTKTIIKIEQSKLI